MSYEVKTPLLLRSVSAALKVIDGVQDGSMDRKDGQVVLGGARVLQAAVREDVRARLAAPKIAEYERRQEQRELDQTG